MKKHFLYMFLLLVGCTQIHSEAPVATRFPTTYQKKLQATEHWSLIAADISKSLKQSIEGKVLKSDKILIHTKSKTPFSKVISYELISTLSKDGYTVINPEKMNKVQADFSVSIDVETEVLKFDDNRKMAGRVGVPSAIATGLWVIKLLDPSPAGAITMGAYGYDTYDYFNDERYSGYAPKSEIVVDIVTTKNDVYVSAIKDIYYVNQTDKTLYEEIKAIENYKTYNIISEVR